MNDSIKEKAKFQQEEERGEMIKRKRGRGIEQGREKKNPQVYKKKSNNKKGGERLFDISGESNIHSSKLTYQIAENVRYANATNIAARTKGAYETSFTM